MPSRSWRCDAVASARHQIAAIAAKSLTPELASREIMALLVEAIPADGYRLFGLDPTTGQLNRLLAASHDDDWARHERLRDVCLSPRPNDYHESHRLAALGLRVGAVNPALDTCWGYPAALPAPVSPREHRRLYHDLQSPHGGVLLARFPADGQWVAALLMYRRDLR